MTDDYDFYSHILSQSNVARTRNSYITPSNIHPLRILDFNNVQNINQLKYFQGSKYYYTSIFSYSYLCFPIGEDVTPSANFWVLADFNSVSGLKLAQEALLFAVS